MALLAAVVLGGAFVAAGARMVRGEPVAAQAVRTLTGTQTIRVLDAQCDGATMTVWLSDGVTLRFTMDTVCPSDVLLLQAGADAVTAVSDSSPWGAVSLECMRRAMAGEIDEVGYEACVSVIPADANVGAM